MKKIFALLISILVVVSCTNPIDDAFENNGDNNTLPKNIIYYTTTDDCCLYPNITESETFGAKLISNTYKNGVGKLIFNRQITCIGESAFEDCTTLTSIRIPGCVTNIGENAFNGCTALKDLRIEDSENTLSIGCNTNNNSSNGLFYDCPLETLYLGRNLSYNTGYQYGYSPFYDMSTLTSVTIGYNVTSLENNTFNGCPIEKLELNCGTIGNWFRNKSSIKEIIFGNNVTIIKDNAFEYCTSLKSIETPNSITSIGNRAFYGTQWENNLPDGIVYVGKVLYKYKGEMENNTSITIKDGTTQIYSNAFYEQKNLTNIIIPNSIASIGDNAFYGCSYLELVINFSELQIVQDSRNNGYVGYYAYKVINAPNGTFVDDFIFAVINGVNTLVGYLGNNNDLKLPDNYKGMSYEIGEKAFYDCHELTYVTIPDGVTKIGREAFKYCIYIYDVILGYGITSIEDYAFAECSHLSKIYIPGNVTRIGNYAFYNCVNLDRVNFANGVKSIGSAAFENCYNLRFLDIGNTIEEIRNYAFNGCENLSGVWITDLDAWNNISFGGYYANPINLGATLFLNNERVEN